MSDELKKALLNVPKEDLIDLLSDSFKLTQELENKIDIVIDFCEKHKIYTGRSVVRGVLEILGDKEQEEYTLTKDENGTTQINGEWYRVEKK